MKGRLVHLIRHRYFGQGFDTLFEFSMRNADSVVEFTVAPSLLDTIDGVPDTAWDQRDIQFLRLRDRIEIVAARRFQESPPADSKAVPLSATDFERWDAPVG
jgi:hypothetical protein